MKVIKKNVYYCDFCNKRLLSTSAMNKHEKHCTRNINRECRLCECGVTLPETVAELKKRFKIVEKERIIPFYGITEKYLSVEWTGKEITMDEIRDITDNCPNCILAILNLVGLNRYYFAEKTDGAFEFDYKKEVNDYFIEKREREEERFY